MMRFVADVPLRVKLIAALLMLVTMALLVIGVASALMMRSSLVDRVDAQLAATAKSVDPDLLIKEASQGNLTLLPSDYVLAYYSLTANQIHIVEARADEDLPPIPRTRQDLNAKPWGKPYTDKATGSQERWRVLFVKRSPTEVLMVGESLSSVDEAVDELVAAELFVGAGCLVVLAAVGVTIVRASLQPLREIERTAAAIAAGDLTRRVPKSPPETEMGHLAGALNAMLSQIEDAFRVRAASEERMRQFVADASHELRTPLTTIRGFAELYRQGAAREPGETRVLLRRIEDEASRMGLLVEDLLLLARLDEERPLTMAPMDLRVIAVDAVAAARAVAPDRPIGFELERDEPIMVDGDESRLRQVVGNLMTNALTHTPADTAVTLRLRRDGTDALVEVADSGPGLTETQAERVFERFYRVDKARTRRAAGGAHSGTGLGLAIVAALVAAHNGTVSVFGTSGGGATFQVRLPLTVGSQAESSTSQGGLSTLKS